MWLAVLSLVFASAMRGATVRAPDFADLVTRADCVARVETAAVRCEWRGEGETRRIVTLVTVRVLEQIVGATPATMELEFLGGEVGDTYLRIVDQPRFQVGDRDILFVQNNGRQFCPLVNMMYGRYPLVSDPVDSTRELVMRETGEALHATSEISRTPVAGERRAAAVAPAQGAASILSAQEFTAEIRRMALALGRKDVQP